MIAKYLFSIVVFLAATCCDSVLMGNQAVAPTDSGTRFVSPDKTSIESTDPLIGPPLSAEYFESSSINACENGCFSEGYFDGEHFFDKACHQIEHGGTQYTFSGLARAYFYNDQRIQWSGQESTFGAEGVLDGAVQRHVHGWNVSLVSELFVNQPYDRNILVDTPNRVSHRGNFEFEALEISRLFVEVSKGDLAISMGKRLTPFGKFYYPVNTNRQFDAPFIRTESISRRETGLQADFTPGIWEFTLGIFNGSEDLDTNSTKAGFGRIGIQQPQWALGASVKWHDGIGSESQKYRNNHAGLDAMIRRGRWQLSGEMIYDEYGFRRPFDPLQITWGRSIYNRGQFSPNGRLHGVGYYLNLNYCGDRWSTNINYGSNTPGLYTGDNIHDQVTHRTVAKLIRHFGHGLESVNTVILENDVDNAQAGRKRLGFMYYTGLEYRF